VPRERQRPRLLAPTTGGHAALEGDTAEDMVCMFAGAGVPLCFGDDAAAAFYAYVQASKADRYRSFRGVKACAKRVPSYHALAVARDVSPQRSSETRNPKPLTLNLKPQTRNPKP